MPLHEKNNGQYRFSDEVWGAELIPFHVHGLEKKAADFEWPMTVIVLGWIAGAYYLRKTRRL